MEMLERLDAVARFLDGVEEAAFLADEMRQMAVAMALLVVGEAAGRLREATRARAASVDWPAIIALRNRIAHGYRSIDHRLTFIIGRDHAPTLRAAVRALLGEIPGGG